MTKARQDRLIIFDCDGVLVDSEAIAARIGAELLRGYGFPLSMEDCLHRYTGMNLASLRAALRAEFGFEPPDHFAADITRAADAAMDRELQPIPGIRDGLQALAGRRRCVASNARLSRVERSLGTAGLLEFFAPDHRFSAEMVAKGKPAPDLFLHAARTMGMTPERCIVIEDSLIGATGALAAGMTVMGFGGASHYGPDHLDRLKALGVARCFASMHDLAAELDALEAELS